MRKTKFLMPLVCFGLLASACTGGGSKSTNHKGDNGLTYANEMFDSTHFVDANFQTSEEQEYTNFKLLGDTFGENKYDDFSGHYDASATKVIDSDEIYNSTYSHSGVLALKNDEGFVGLWSIYFNDWIVKPSLVPNTFTYTVASTEEIGPLTELHYRERFELYDCLGHLLASSINPFDFDTYVTSGKAENADIYGIDLFYYDPEAVFTDVDTQEQTIGGYVNKHYIYDTNGAIRESDESYQSMGELPETEYDPYMDGQPFDLNFVDLADYGLPGYELLRTNNETYAVYAYEIKTTENGDSYKNKSFVRSFTVDMDVYQPVGIIGQEFIFRGQFALPEDATEYTFYYNNNKWLSEQFTINVVTGEKKALDYNILISGTTPINSFIEDETGAKIFAKGEYFQLFYKEIKGEKVLAEDKIAVVDKNFVVVSDVTGVNNSEFILMQDTDEYNTSRYYYHVGSKLIYLEGSNGKFTPVTSLTGYQEIIPLPEYHCFIVRHDNKYGILSASGYVRYKPVYNWIDTQTARDGCFFAHDSENGISRLSMNYGSRNHYLETRTELGEKGLYRIRDYNYTEFGHCTIATANRELFSYPNYYNFYSYMSSYMGSRTMFGHESYFFDLQNDQYYQEYDEYTSSYTYKGRHDVYVVLEDGFNYQFVSNGQENTGTLELGTYDNPYILQYGENKIDVLMNAYTYVRFVAPEDEKYGLLTDDITFNYYARAVYTEHVVNDPDNPDDDEFVPHDESAAVTNYQEYDDIFGETQHNIARLASWDMVEAGEYTFGFMDNNAPRQVTITVAKIHEHEVEKWSLPFMYLNGIEESSITKIRTGTCSVDNKVVFESAPINSKSISAADYLADLAEQEPGTYYGGFKGVPHEDPDDPTKTVVDMTWYDNTKVAAFKAQATMTADGVQACIDGGYDISVTKYFFADDADETALCYIIEASKQDMVAYTLSSYRWVVSGDALIVAYTHYEFDYNDPDASVGVMYMNCFLETKDLYDAAKESYNQSLN